MANPTKGEVSLRLNDETALTLVMDFDMRVAVEELCDKPFDQVAQRAAQGFHGAVRALMWGALQRHHSTMTMGEVTSLIEDHGEELQDAMIRAGEAASPDASAGGKAQAGNRKARRATKTSGASGAKPA